MTKEEIRDIVLKIFGKEAADDDDIVTWYMSVHGIAFQEYAKQQSIAFEKWKRDNEYYYGPSGFVGQNQKWFNSNGITVATSDEQLYDIFLKQQSHD